MTCRIYVCLKYELRKTVCYIEVFSMACSLFYFFFESRSNKRTAPVVIWLSGGPGCSSEIALFYENGPFGIADNMTLHWNDFGWDKVYTDNNMEISSMN